VRLKLIGCEIFYREICAVVARSIHQIDVEFLPKGLHDIGSAKMLARLQEVVDQVDASCYEKVLLGYALCGMGLVGLRARSLPIVLPRAHDCITLFLGSKERYLEYFNNHPGVYFKTTGWLERGDTLTQTGQLAVQNLTGMTSDFQELVAKYGEENARFLYDELCNYTRNYSQFTFIEMGVEPDDRFERRAREQAAEKGWKYDKVAGDMSLFQHLVDGPWEEREFLVLRPGQKIVPRYNEDIMGVEEAE
jgi:hypothetical protein